MINWIKKNRLEFGILVFILLAALALRLYRIEGFMTYLGDEGRDVRIVRDLITKGDLVFIGPQTSIGNMYLGPLYYYLMAPALFLSGLDPVGPAIMVALLSVLTVFLTWLFGRKWFGRASGILAALFFAISPVAITYGRTSWNPNPMPLFALLSIWGIYRVWQKKDYSWLPWVGITTAFAIQMHYLGLLLVPTIVVIWFLTPHKKAFVRHTIFAVLLFLLLMSPLVLFDLKHQGQNLKALTAMLSSGSGIFDLGSILSKPFTLLSFAGSSLLSGIQKPSVLFTVVVSIVTIIFLFIKHCQPQIKIISLWLLFTLVGLSFYNQSIYIHYLGVIYPAIFLVAGYLLATLFEKGTFFKLLVVTCTLLIVYLSLKNSPTFGSPNRQLERTRQTVDLIIKESKGEPFNFGLIAKQNYDESYRYFLENEKASLVRGEDKITDQLFVICEDGDLCQPEGNPQWQIAVFGPSHVVGTWQIDFLKIYRLVHTK